MSRPVAWPAITTGEMREALAIMEENTGTARERATVIADRAREANRLANCDEYTGQP